MRGYAVGYVWGTIFDLLLYVAEALIYQRE